MKRLSLPHYVRPTGAKFETTERFLASSTVVDTLSPELETAGVPMTRVSGTTFATSQDELHAFIIGDSGCGKTRRVILPSIRLYAKAKRSLVISDPKGELYRATADALQKNGYQVLVLNFRNPSRGNRWNPLRLIEQLYRTGNQEDKDRAMLMLKDICDIMQQAVHSEKDRFWQDAAAKVLLGIALLILEYGQEGELTFENISIVSKELFACLENKGSYSKNSVGKGNFLAQMKQALPKNAAIMENLQTIMTMEPGGRNSIIGVFSGMLSVYTNQESLKDLFSDSDIDVERLGQAPTALFFILPDDSEALYPIATVFVKQIYSTLINLADGREDGKLHNPVTFLLDEFANFAPIPAVASMLTAARSRRITFVLVCQSMEQLQAKYGSDQAETLLANCRLWIYMSCRNLPFLRRLEELMGYYISPHTGERRPLVDIGELQHFDMGQVLILNNRCSPTMGYLPDYSEYKFGDEERYIKVDLPAKRAYERKPGFNFEAALLRMTQKAVAAAAAAATEATKKTATPATGALRRNIEGMITDSHRKAAEEQAAAAAKAAEEVATPKTEETTPRERWTQEPVATVDGEMPQTAEAPEEAPKETPKETPAAEPARTADSGASGLRHGNIAYGLYEAGKVYEAAQYLIDHIDAPGVSKTALFFLIRYKKLDTSRLKAAFSLDAEELLLEGFRRRDSATLMNLTLMSIDMGDYEQAIQFLRRTPRGDLGSAKRFFDYWHGRAATGENLMVRLLIARMSKEQDAEAISGMENLLRDTYRPFLESELYLKWAEENVPRDES